MSAGADYADMAIMRRLVHQVRPYWPHITAIFLIGLLAAPLALLTPLPLKIAVDNVLGHEPLPELLDAVLPVSVKNSATAILVFAALMVVIVALLAQLQVLGSALLSTYTGEKVSLDFRTALFRHVQGLSLSYHDATGTAESLYSIQYDTEAIRYLAIDGITPFISAAVTFVAMLFVMFRIDWRLALVALGISPFLFMIARTYRRSLRQQSRQVRRIESGALSIVQEVLASLRVVKAFGQERREQARFEEQSYRGLKARLNLQTSQGFVGLSLSMTTAVGTALVLYIGVRDVQAGTITLGELLLVMGYLAQLYLPLKTISRKVTSMQSHLARAERAFALLDTPPGVSENPDGKTVDRAQGAITVEHLSFAYRSGQEVLRDITFAVEPGSRVGIVGETGAGKSTLVGLLTRFHDPGTGRILLDGVDLRDYKLADLRNQFAVVLQDTVLFSTTVGENIAYAQPDASAEEIVAAAKTANAHEFIRALPEGYDTLVGERGMLLSGGERQRISLARAFLKDAPILILDEPTSSVDIKTESGILEAMERLTHGRTTFMIAHRLGTLLNCDLVLTLHDGQLEEQDATILEMPEYRLVTSRQEASGNDSRNGVPATRSVSSKESILTSNGRPGRPILIDWQESAEDLRDRYRQEQNELLRMRLQALLLVREGKTLTEINKTLPVSYRTLQRWLSWYRAGGVDELLRHETRRTREELV